MPTIASLFENTVSKYPDRPALACGAITLSYAAWNARVRRFAQALFNLGVRQMDRVAILQKTSEATPTAYMACQLLGAIAVPMNHRLSPDEADAPGAPGAPGLPNHHHCFEALIDGVTRLDAPLPQPGAEDISAIVYTSGTTGRPKG